MIRMREGALALVVILASVAVGCQKEKATAPPARDDPFSGKWIGTWSVTTQVNWGGGLNCPPDTILTALVVIQDSDKIDHLLNYILPSSLRETVPYLSCGMEVSGNDISFGCEAVTTIDGCVVSTSQNGSGSAASDGHTFTVTMDAQYQVQVSSQCSAVDCSMNAVSNATRLTSKGLPS